MGEEKKINKKIGGSGVPVVASRPCRQLMLLVCIIIIVLWPSWMFRNHSRPHSFYFDSFLFLSRAFFVFFCNPSFLPIFFSHVSFCFSSVHTFLIPKSQQALGEELASGCKGKNRQIVGEFFFTFIGEERYNKNTENSRKVVIIMMVTMMMMNSQRHRSIVRLRETHQTVNFFYFDDFFFANGLYFICITVIYY